MYKTLPSYNKHGFTLLSLDPGPSNFGIACTEYNNGKVRLLANATLDSPIKGLTEDIQLKQDAFIKEIDQWISNFKCGALIAERFQARGLLGTTSEEVNIMLGCLLNNYSKLKIKLVIASTWKNAFRRKHGFNLKDYYMKCKTTPHQLDAFLIGVYGLEIGFKQDFKYSIDDAINAVEQTSLVRLINRKSLR